jgi:hypothetical protein
MKRREMAGLKKGDEIEISGERWAKVLHSSLFFPWLVDTVLIESGWPIHRDHITAIRRK